MFGLMQPESCSNTDSSFNQQRLHYCATCKVLGKEYGQKTRLLLNYDAVFLAELLSALSQEKSESWKSELQAVNKCFTMPKSDSESPIALHYAAAANVLFAKLKIRDNIADSSSLWHLAERII